MGGRFLADGSAADGASPEGVTAEDVFVGVVAGFGQHLHSAGVPVTPERSTRFAHAVAAAQPRTLDDVYWLGRVTLVTARQQIEVYDRVFDRVFRGLLSFEEVPKETVPSTMPHDATTADLSTDETLQEAASADAGDRTTSTPGEAADTDEDAREEQSLAAVSIAERLVERDFSACTPEELVLIRRLVEQLPLVPPPRRARRMRRHRAGHALDMRATLRRSQRTGGEAMRLVTRQHTQRPRRVVLIADVSGSMEPYARVYLHLVRGAVRALGAEAFAFATRLTRLTRQLDVADPDTAYRRALEAAPDWSGGTRIGRALTTFLDEYGRRGMARGAVVVIVSDGWEIDDPALVGESMQRLSRLAHHIIWVNPRKASAYYEPLVGGMAAALPYVDTFVSGHSVRALEEVMAAIRNATERATPDQRRTRVPA
jgi:uncharacterized protein with von Willebrand factor type A (vWA) domain